MRVAVTGGAGLMGTLVSAGLAARGHETLAVSRRTGVDVLTGRGLDAAIRGVDAVVDCTNLSTASAGRSLTFFTGVARHLADAVLRAGVPHLVALSIIGAEKREVQRALGYYRGKAAQERTLAAAGAPVTLVRSTQWFDLTETLLGNRVGPVSFVPRMLAQPVAAAAVAELLVDVVEAGYAGGGRREVAGPEQRDMAELAAAVAQQRHPGRRVLAFTLPGSGRALASGALLPDASVATAGPRFEEWLRSRR